MRRDGDLIADTVNHRIRQGHGRMMAIPGDHRRGMFYINRRIVFGIKYSYLVTDLPHTRRATIIKR